MKTTLSLLAAFTATCLLAPSPSAQAAGVIAQWFFDDFESAGTTADARLGFVGTFQGGAGHSAAGEGLSGMIGDYAYVPGSSAGSLVVDDAAFLAELNAATAGQQLSISYWQNLTGTPNATAFWANSPGTAGGNRGLSAHSPWSDGNTYFDTSGCCNGDTRISAPLGATPGTWEMMTFVYDNGTKSIYRNTTLVASGAGAAPLLTNLDAFIIGNSINAGEGMAARIDWFGVWSHALTTDEIELFYGLIIPEPSTSLLGLAGALALGLRRRRTA